MCYSLLDYYNYWIFFFVFNCIIDVLCYDFVGRGKFYLMYIVDKVVVEDKVLYEM